MKINALNVVAFAIIIGLVTFMFYDHKADAERLKQLNSQIDSLNHTIDLKEQQIFVCYAKIAKLTDSIAIADKQINRFQNELKQIKNKYAKIKPTDNATPVEVADFFANRYGQ